jgi:hypothetical protein
MRTIGEQNLLVRTQAELPAGLKMAREDYREGWSFARSADARRLKKKIEKHGWNLVRGNAGFERGGVGPTSQHAIAGALTLALRRLTAHFNAVEIEHIQLTQYPWFFLARVIVHPYRIQQSAMPSVCDDAVPLPARARQGSMPVQKAALHPLFASAMPELKEMLVVS